MVRQLSLKNSEPLVSVHGQQIDPPFGPSGPLYTRLFPPLDGSDLFGKAELAADRPRGLMFGEPAFRRQGVTVALSPEGVTFATCSPRTVRLWDTGTGKPIGPALELGGSTRVAFTRDGKRLLVANLTTADDRKRGYEIRYVDVLTGTVVGEPAAGSAVGASASGALRDLLWTPDGTGFVTAYGSTKTVLRFWDAKTLQPVGDPLPGGSEVNTFGTDGKTLLTVSGDEIALWDVPGRKRVSRLPTPGVPKAVGFGVGRVHVREVAQLRPWFAVLPDGHRVLLRDTDRGSDGTHVRLWDLGTDPPAEKLALKHAGPVYWVAVSRDGKAAATCSAEDGLHVWDLDTGRPRLRVPIAQDSGNRLKGLAFSPGGRLLATANAGDVQLWKLDVKK
jgi:WD40 repeat protein